MEGDNIMNVQEEITKGALYYNPCDGGMEQIRNAKSKVDMVQCYLDRIDFCLAYNFPDNECIKTEFEKEAEDKNIYVDRKVTLHNSPMAVFLGNSISKFVATDSVSRIYVKHSSKLNIQASGNAFVVVDALDDADIIVECKENAEVVVNLYSHATSSGATKTVHKNRETYEL